jgi:Cd2+/Zn2+-exporting ATPase
VARAGLDEVHAELMPAQKVDAIHALRAQYGPVAMVGDGINDAPALAAADVGIAMGAAGSDVALETADVVLMSDDLSKLPFALRLGRATLANIRQNVAIALTLKIAFVLLAAGGFATMWMAIVADTGASLIVTANSIRLLRYR